MARPGGNPDLHLYEKGASKFTPEIRERFLTLARLGCTIQIICENCRITDNTWYNWKNCGEKGEEPYAQFVKDVIAARAEKAVEMQEVLDKQIKKRGDPKYAMKYLSTFHGVKDTPPTKQVEITQQTNVSVMPAFDVDKLTDEEFQTWCALVDKMKPGGGKVSGPENTEPFLIEIPKSE